MRWHGLGVQLGQEEGPGLGLGIGVGGSVLLGVDLWRLSGWTAGNAMVHPKAELRTHGTVPDKLSVWVPESSSVGGPATMGPLDSYDAAVSGLGEHRGHVPHSMPRYTPSGPHDHGVLKPRTWLPMGPEPWLGLGRCPGEWPRPT